MRLYRNPSLLTRRNVWLFLRYVCLHAFIIHASLGAIANVRNRMVRSEEYGAILLSDRVADDLTLRSISALAWFGAYPYWTYYFNNRGMKARWFLSAKSGDLKAAVRDPRCQSIVLVGHGSFCLWAATDADVTNDEMTAFMKDQPKKKGEWLQLTCGVPDAWPVKLGELVMDPARVYTYAKSINAYYLVTDALFGFKYIKSLKTRLGSKP
ncbi:MAG TPA: hypothetical protein VNI01_05510 [Elusimicrobiota bacterium]|nr:hypothetical protein [Elusimicrobiota bacterium]